MNTLSECKKAIKLKSNIKYEQYKSQFDTLMGEEQYNKIIPKDEVIMNTFKYMYYKVGSGIFIQIKNNKIEKYYPFFNPKFKNEFSHLIKTDSDYFKKNKVRGPLLSKEKGRANNCLIKVIDEFELGSTYITEFKEILENILKLYKLKDICFNSFDNFILFL